MHEYVCMNIDVMNIYEYVRRNIDFCISIDVRVPSLIAGSLPAIMIWHKSTIVDWLLLFLVFTTAEELALHELATIWL